MRSNVLKLELAAMALSAIGAITVSLPTPALADNSVTLPPMPDKLVVEAGNVPYLVGHAVGTQNYICLPAGPGFAWTLFTPEATLFDDDDKQIITHFFSVNPDPKDGGAIRATWLSKDSSTIWAKAIQSSTDAPFVAKDAIPWVTLQVLHTEEGPTGGDKLFHATFVQRLSTAGGVAPATGCAQLADVGAKAFVPYTADYFFYK
jgi:hypothetical protein